MKIQRSLPPAASPIYIDDIFHGILGFVHGQAEVERFESELKGYLGVKYCFLFSSGKAALATILESLKVLYPDKDEVIIPAYTCYSVPSAIVRAGLKIRLCDINPDTLDFNYHHLSSFLSSASNHRKENQRTDGEKKDERHPSDRILAVIPTHFFGIASDIEKIRQTLNNRNIMIIEDAAQALGGVWRGKKLGTLGDIGFFSLGRGKAFSTVEGGIVVTDRDDIAGEIEDRLMHLPGYSWIETIRLLLGSIVLCLFLKPILFWLPKGLPFLKLGETFFNPNFKIRKFSPFQAGLAKRWKVKLTRFNQGRLENSEEWRNLIRQLESVEIRSFGSVLSFPPIRFPLRIQDTGIRERILKQSHKKGLGIMPTYPDTVDGIEELKKEFENQILPRGKSIAKEIVTLPTHLFISKKDRRKLALLLSDVLK